MGMGEEKTENLSIQSAKVLKRNISVSNSRTIMKKISHYDFFTDFNCKKREANIKEFCRR